MKLDIYKATGEKSDKKANLANNVFAIKPNEHCVYLAVKSELANMRQGTHKVKTRGEKRGGGAKPWRQKGRGTARAGSRRSPVWVGGGIVFGPKPHEYKRLLPKKVKRLARRSALSQKLMDKSIRIVDSFDLKEPRTKEFQSIIDALDLKGRKLTILVKDVTENLYLASRNIPKVYIVPAERASTYEIMDCDVLVIEKDAVDSMNEILK